MLSPSEQAGIRMSAIHKRAHGEHRTSWLGLVPHRALALLVFPWLDAPRLEAQSYTVEGAIASTWRGTSSNTLYTASGILGGISSGTSSGAGFILEGPSVPFEPPVLPPTLPALSVNRTGQNIEISWASPDGLAQLQQAPNLAGTSWSDAPVIPVRSNGRWVATLGAATGTQFFRLTASPPQLAFRRSGPTLEVSWSSADRSFVLQESPTLAASPAWSDVPRTPALIQGRWVVALPFQTGSRFLRLRRP